MQSYFPAPWHLFFSDCGLGSMTLSTLSKIECVVISLLPYSCVSRMGGDMLDILFLLKNAQMHFTQFG